MSDPATVSRRTLLAAGAGTVAALTLPGTASADSARVDSAPVDTVLEWYDLTAAAVGVITGPQQVTNSRTWAIGWIAAWRALSTVDGRRAPEAALAGAVHAAVAALLPARTLDLDAALGVTLARLGDSPAVQRGLEAGRRSAAAVLTERTGDGLDLASVNRPYPTPAPAPGIWQPTPPAYATAVQSGQGDGRPFVVRDVRPYQPGPPPALDSEPYAKDLTESHRVGALDSTVRTPHQTDVAQFWAQTSLNGYTGALRPVLSPTGSHAASRAHINRRAGLVALFHAITIDAQITTYAAKYRYLRWRPVTAIRTGTINPDPAWTPLITTPAHPEYPSGHTTYAGAAETILTALAGPPRSAIELTSPVAPGVTLRYTAWHELTRDNIDARVWSGIHFRHTDEAGAAVGRTVATAALAHWQGRPL